jgi:hypothetical protein
LPAQRQIQVPWQDYIRLPDVVLVPVDERVTSIDFSMPMQVAQGSVVSDEDGSRRATMLFRQETTAEMVMPDGSMASLPNLQVRATEYTVGPNGPKAMPAELPPSSGYTHIVQFNSEIYIPKILK